jgi:NTP pyrophosphatase (non-canonical NTP hydrolase)
MESININELAQSIHNNAVAHGWWDEERSVAEIVALCHSELSEALEAYRNGEPLEWDNNGKPDGIAVELIDCVIRVFDYLAKEQVDIEKIILTKHEFNKSRPYKHGGKKI